jgi:bidirectional [NiFe] hydrogenase diaphorase subunit
MMLKLRVDDQEIKTKEGKTVLQACLDNQIYIPNLCYLEDMESPSASCRMCFVEIEGMPQPVPSCTVQVNEDMVVKTDTPVVRQLQRTALRLLLSVHDVD